jgi:hypothetical protein
MKKLLIKSEFVTIPYSPEILPVSGVSEHWVKEVEIDGVKGLETKYEVPMLEDGTIDVSYEYVPAIEPVEGKPEQPEIKEWIVIAQTQGSDEDLAIWLEGDKFKYPQDAIAEYHELSYEDKLQECFHKRKSEYPSPEDFMNAWFDGGAEVLNNLELKRLAVKAKYPKPTFNENTLIETVILFPVIEPQITEEQSLPDFMD